jgi:hypothetical protein
MPVLQKIKGCIMFRILGFIVGVGVVFILFQTDQFSTKDLLQEYFKEDIAPPAQDLSRNNIEEEIISTDKILDKPDREKILQHTINAKNEVMEVKVDETIDVATDTTIDERMELQAIKKNTPMSSITDTATELSVNESLEKEIPNEKEFRVTQQSIWSPFKYKESAEAFARNIRERAHIAVFIEQNNKNQYLLILKAKDKNTIDKQIVLIEQALGLKFSKAM